MGLKIAIPKETAPFEKRVAVSPDTVKKYVGMGCAVLVETGAGVESAITDEAFVEAGASIVKTAQEGFAQADIILCVQMPDVDSIRKGTVLIGMLAPYANQAVLHKVAKAGVDLFAMEFVPRITRAQTMDVLSSQSNLAGYRAVLDAANEYTRSFAMMMTAAGTVPPARVFVMGAGVAGLQAIATARRLGAIVSATDVRPAAKEQVQSLGASFVAVEDEEFKQAETAGGYAKEMSDSYKAKQAELIAQTLAKQDIVITTALIPGRPAPRLITREMVGTMKSGAVLVDMAVEAGGNIEGSKLGEIVDVKGVKILGHANLPSRLSSAASALYARNLSAFLSLMIDKEDGSLKIDREDEIIKGVGLSADGALIHPAFAEDTPKPKTKKTTKRDEAEESDSGD